MAAAHALDVDVSFDAEVGISLSIGCFPIEPSVQILRSLHDLGHMEITNVLATKWTNLRRSMVAAIAL
ncbi:hypothetical protein HAX54_046125 [Datura stramonium]|uniref:Uncharacterized protein n=1 Tax=Datura stramonium TaxID=4076 RepID=A0ABS8SRC0_DATST|nr:hypothetical protein [Datura stramonium]